MKALLLAALLMSLQSLDLAQAYEADIHYSTTYALARAAGWTKGDALIIASANQAMDENQDTVAALEIDTAGMSLASNAMSTLRQAERNLVYHCFSKTHDEAGEIAADVRETISQHLERVPAEAGNSAQTTRRLIALGVALHCQQDAHSHAGFGGSCGAYPGNCHGHTYQTLLDEVVFRALKKHFFNPDHPGVSGKQLLDALEATARELALHRPRKVRRFIAPRALIALSESLRASGLELADQERRECNRLIAGRWLFEHAEADGQDEVVRLGPEVAATCRNASLASATVVDIPVPRLPRLDADASPSLVRADGSYQVIRGGNLADGNAGIIPGRGDRKARVQLSHWSQILALPLRLQFASTASHRRMR